MLPGWRTTKYVERDLKPFIDISMYLIVLCTQRFGRHFFFKGFSLGGSPVFVGATNIKCRSSSGFVVSGNDLGIDRCILGHEQKYTPGEYICAKNAADNVSEMGNIVDIWECGGDQDIPLALFWENLAF